MRQGAGHQHVERVVTEQRIQGSGIGVKSGRATTGSVQCLGTTATVASGLTNPELSTASPLRRAVVVPDWESIGRAQVADRPLPEDGVTPLPPHWSDDKDPAWLDELEYVWSSRTEGDAKNLDARSARRERQAHAVASDSPTFAVMLRRSAEWAAHRAQAMRMRRADVADACGKRFRSVECGCGSRDALVRCEQPQLCGTCRRIHAMSWRKRIVAGMERGLRDARSLYWRTPRYRRRGMVPGIYLITLTGPHSGEFSTDRDAMGKAVRKLLKHAHAEGWWSTYALTWEATNGDDGLGHLHVHIAVISSWVPYTGGQVESNDPLAWAPHRCDSPGDRCRHRSRRQRGLFEVWRSALPGALVLDVKPPGQSSDAAFSAGSYLAKYVTKGVEASEFTGQKAGELLVAFRSRRKVSTSEGFWIPPITECECCGEEYRSLGAPCSLRELNPGAFLRTWLPYSSSYPSQRTMRV